MIVALLLSPIFYLVNSLLSLLPDMGSIPSWINDTLTVIGYGLQIVPIDVWIFCLGSIIFWSFGQIGWAIIEWIYKKIPGVD